jgi:hypothetical protein
MKKHCTILMLLSLVNLLAAQPEDASYIATAPIPEIFTSAKLSTSMTSFDQSVIITNTVPDNFNFQLYNTLTDVPFSTGKISLLESGEFDSQTDKFKNSLCKLFYSNKLGFNTIGMGIGYTYNKIAQLENSDYTYDLSEGYSESHESIFIQDYTTNAFFANMNGIIPINCCSSFLLGADFNYTTKRGFEFDETYDYYSDPGIYYSSSTAVNYYNYNRHAYDYNHSIGIGLIENHTTKNNLNKLLSLNLIWRLNKEYSEPKYVDNMQSYFLHRTPNSIQFSCVNNLTNKLSLELLFAQNIPDQFNTPRMHLFTLSWCTLTCDWIRLALYAADNHFNIMYVNRWMRSDDVYWGKTDRKNDTKPLGLYTDHSYTIRIFKYLYGNLDFFSDNKLFIYKDNSAFQSEFSGSFHFGIKIPLHNKFLFDFNYALINSQVYSSIDSTYDPDASLFIDFHPTISFRFSIMK